MKAKNTSFIRNPEKLKNNLTVPPYRYTVQPVKRSEIKTFLNLKNSKYSRKPWKQKAPKTKKF